MNDNETNISLKEKVVQVEIVDKNYDKKIFLRFCNRKKANGDDLQQWTLSELNNLIMEYCAMQEPNGLYNPSRIMDKGDEIKEIINIEIEKIKLRNQETNGLTDEISCKKLEKNWLNDKTITVVLENPMITESNFFEPNYVTYEVVTEELKWFVRRRYSDFEWLRTYIVKCFPKTFVYPLPKKSKTFKLGKGNRKFDMDFVTKRMVSLQLFISEIMKNEAFKTTEGLISFLSITNRQLFESKVKELNTYQSPTSVEDIKTLTGTLLLKHYDESFESYYINMKNYFTIQSKILTRLNDNAKRYNKNIMIACEALEEIGKDFEALYLLNGKVSMKEKIEKTYEELGLFAHNYRKTMIKQNMAVRTHIKIFFKEVHLEGTIFSELIQNREEIKSKFINESNKLNSKKEKLWLAKETNKWEMIDDPLNPIDPSRLTNDRTYAISKMCSKETDNLSSIHKQLGYTSMSLMNEINHYMFNHNKKFEENITQYVKELFTIITGSVNACSGLTAYMSQSEDD